MQSLQSYSFTLIDRCTDEANRGRTRKRQRIHQFEGMETGCRRICSKAIQAAKRGRDDRPIDTSVQLIDTIQDYKKEVVDEQERIVAVRFFAPWCKSCKAAHPHFKKIVSRHSPYVKFIDVPLTKETAYIHEGLGVPSVPFGHIYHPDAGLVEEMKINKKVIGEFGDALESYVNVSCDLPLDEESVEFEVEAGTEADGFQ